MHHWNNKLLCRLQGTPLAPYAAHGVQQARSSRDEIQPTHRCTVPSICPHIDTAFQQTRCLVVTVEDQVSGRGTGVHSVTHVS